MSKPADFWRWSALGLAVVAMVAGCTPQASSPPAAPPATKPVIGAPCPLSSPSSSHGAEAGSPRVFVELATVEGDLQAALRGPAGAGSAQLPPPGFAGLLSDPRVRVPRAWHVLASDGVPSTVAWDLEKKDHEGQCPQVERWDVTVIAHVDAAQPSNVRLEVQRAPAPPLGTRPENWYIPEHRRAQTTVVVHDQQTVVLGGFGEQEPQQARSMLLVTPYVIWDDADLRRLFECKMKRAGGPEPLPLPAAK